MFYHVDDSLLADVCIMTNYFCLCEWWFSAAVCSYKTAFCPKPSSFSMSDCAARGSVAVPRSLGKHASVLQSGGSRCKEQLWVPPTMLGGPIREQNLARRTSSKHAANGTFICLPSHPLPQRPSFTGIHSAISSSPMATAGLVNRGTTFSWCHRAVNDLQPLESWWNSLNWYFIANTKQQKFWIYRYEASLWTGWKEHVLHQVNKNTVLLSFV